MSWLERYQHFRGGFFFYYTSLYIAGSLGPIILLYRRAVNLNHRQCPDVFIKWVFLSLSITIAVCLHDLDGSWTPGSPSLCRQLPVVNNNNNVLLGWHFGCRQLYLIIQMNMSKLKRDTWVAAKLENYNNGMRAYPSWATWMLCYMAKCIYTIVKRCCTESLGAS